MYVNEQLETLMVCHIVLPNLSWKFTVIIVLHFVLFYVINRAVHVSLGSVVAVCNLTMLSIHFKTQNEKSIYSEVTPIMLWHIHKSGNTLFLASVK